MDKPSDRKIYQDTKKKEILDILYKGKSIPTLTKYTRFPDYLKGVDFLGGGYAIIPPSKIDNIEYKPINQYDIKNISIETLEKIKRFFLYKHSKKSTIRRGFFDILTGKINLKALSNKTGKDEHVYWKSTYLEAFYNLELEYQDIIPLLEKNQPHFDLKKTMDQIPHIDWSIKPMTNEKYKEYFPNYKKKYGRPKSNKPATKPLYIVIANKLKKKYNLITMQDTDEIYIKNGNIYTNNLGAFKNDLAKLIEFYGKSITHMSNEVIKRIKYTTQFDRHKFCYDSGMINFHNGYYDVENDMFFPNDEYNDKLFCYEIPHDYNPKFEGDCKKFKSLLKDWLGDNNNVKIDDIFEMMGYSMTMNVDMKTAFFIYGPTNTGKTQFQTILEYVIGHNNRSSIPLQRLEKNEFGSDGLEFKLLNMVGDMSKLSPNDTSTFKMLTGDDKWIPAELKGGKKYEFRNIIKIWYNGNKIVVLMENDEAFYGRWILINFPNQHPMNDENTIKRIGELLCDDKNEIQAIIYECIKGVKRLYKRNYFRYQIIKNTKHVWRHEAEPLYAFLYDNCKFDDEEMVVSRDFKRKYNKYLYNKKEKMISTKALNDQLEKFGIYQERHGTGNDRDYYYIGVKWKDQDLEDEWKEKGYFK